MSRYAIFTENFGRKIKRAVAGADRGVDGPGGSPAGLLASYSCPVQITDNFAQDNYGVWVALARRLWRVNHSYIMRGNEIEVFAPCNTEQKPNTKVGDRVFAIYRGEWEMVGGVGGGSTLFPVVLKYIGGNQGTASTPATWKYYVYMLDGVTRLENEPIDPTEFPHQWKRPSIGAMSIATFGYAHYNDERKIVIGWINEVALQERCFI